MHEYFKVGIELQRSNNNKKCSDKKKKLIKSHLLLQFPPFFYDLFIKTSKSESFGQ
jgi:hypothetical protein